VEASVKVLACSLVLLVSLLATNCGGGYSSPQNSPSSHLRILQASGDLGNVDVQINGNTVANNLGWRQTFPANTTTYSSVQAGSIHYQEFAAGTSSPALLDTNLNLSPNTFFTVVTVGEQSSASIGTILLTDDHVAPSSGQLRLRFVNAASQMGPMDLYFASGNSGFPATPSVSALAFKSVTSYFTFSGASVQLCANPTGLPPTLGGLSGIGGSCQTTITLQFQTPPQNSVTFLFLDAPPPPPNAPPGGFILGPVLASVPF
jgi:hypothetical protein